MLFRSEQIRAFGESIGVPAAALDDPGAFGRVLSVHGPARYDVVLVDGSGDLAGDIAALEELAGGTAWSWSRAGDRLVPSLQSACHTGKLDWFLLRTLWENGALSDEPAFYHHTGCHGISPPYAKIRAFDHPSYGVRQGGEALLLFGRGLALIGRAKVFYDEPKRFAETLAAGGTWGDAWRRYYEEESKAPTWGKAGGDIGRKRA